MKMIYEFSQSDGHRLTYNQLEYSIRRNFGGLPPGVLDIMSIFEKSLTEVRKNMTQNWQHEPPLGAVKMIETSLSGEFTRG